MYVKRTISYFYQKLHHDEGPNHVINNNLYTSLKAIYIIIKIYKYVKTISHNNINNHDNNKLLALKYNLFKYEIIYPFVKITKKIYIQVLREIIKITLCNGLKLYGIYKNNIRDSGSINEKTWIKKFSHIVE